MQTQVNSEKTYSVSYFKPGMKSAYGLSVAVSGDKKAKVIREAKEILRQAQADALEVYNEFNPRQSKTAEATETEE